MAVDWETALADVPKVKTPLPGGIDWESALADVPKVAEPWPGVDAQDTAAMKQSSAQLAAENPQMLYNKSGRNYAGGGFGGRNVGGRWMPNYLLSDITDWNDLPEDVRQRYLDEKFPGAKPVTFGPVQYQGAEAQLAQEAKPTRARPQWSEADDLAELNRMLGLTPGAKPRDIKAELAQPAMRQQFPDPETEEQLPVWMRPLSAINFGTAGTVASVLDMGRMIGNRARSILPGKLGEPTEDRAEDLYNPAKSLYWRNKAATDPLIRRRGYLRTERPLKEAILDPNQWVRWFGENAPQLGIGAGLAAATGGASAFVWMGIQEGGQHYRRAIEEGADEKTAAAEAMAVGAVNGYLEMLGIERFLKIPGANAAKNTAISKLKHYALQALGQAGFEGATEGVQNAWSELAAFAGHKPEGQTLSSAGRNIAEGTVVGTGLGGVMGGGGSMLNLAGAKSASRADVAEALGVKPGELPAELRSQEARVAAVEQAKAAQPAPEVSQIPTVPPLPVEAPQEALQGIRPVQGAVVPAIAPAPVEQPAAKAADKTRAYTAPVDSLTDTEVMQLGDELAKANMDAVNAGNMEREDQTGGTMLAGIIRGAVKDGDIGTLRKFLAPGGTLTSWRYLQRQKLGLKPDVPAAQPLPGIGMPPRVSQPQLAEAMRGALQVQGQREQAAPGELGRLATAGKKLLMPEKKAPADVPAAVDMQAHKAALLAKAAAWDKAHPVGATITDRTPEGYGPAEDSGFDPNAPNLERLPAPDAVEVQKLRNSISEGQTILKGKMSDARRESIESAVANSQRKLDVLLSHAVPAAPPVQAAEGKAIPGAKAEKQPWEMTRAEFVDADARQYAETGYRPNAAISGKDILSTIDWLRTQLGDKSMSMYGTGDSYEFTHALIVAKALREGKPVPPEVLADYPDLAPKVAPPAEAVAPKKSSLAQARKPKEPAPKVAPKKSSLAQGRKVEKKVRLTSSQKRNQEAMHEREVSTKINGIIEGVRKSKEPTYVTPQIQIGDELINVAERLRGTGLEMVEANKWRARSSAWISYGGKYAQDAKNALAEAYTAKAQGKEDVVLHDNSGRYYAGGSWKGKGTESRMPVDDAIAYLKDKTPEGDQEWAIKAGQAGLYNIEAEAAREAFQKKYGTDTEAVKWNPETKKWEPYTVTEGIRKTPPTPEEKAAATQRKPIKPTVPEAEMERLIAESEKPADVTLVGADILGDEGKANLREFGKGVPAFRVNPTFTVVMDGPHPLLEFKDKYRFRLQPTAIGMGDFADLKAGQTVRINAPEIVKPIRQADIGKAAPVPAPSGKPAFGSKEGADAARARLKAKGAKPPARFGRKGERGGLEVFDAQDLKDITEIGLNHFISGARTLQAWTRKMVEDVGNPIREWAQDIWDTIQEAGEAYLAAERATGKPFLPAKKAIAETIIKAGAGEPITFTPNLLLRFAMQQQAKAAKKGYRAGQLDLNATHEELLNFAKENLPEGEYKLVAKTAERIISQRTPAEREKIIQAVNRMAQNIEKASVISDFKEAMKEARKARLRPEFETAIDELTKGFTVTESRPDTLNRAMNRLKAAAGDDIGEIPQRLIDRATKILSESTKPNVRDLDLDEVRIITDAVRATIHESNLKNRLHFGRMERDAAEAIETASREVTERKGVRYAEAPGMVAKTTPTRRGIASALNAFGENQDARVARIAGEDSEAFKILVEHPVEGQNETTRIVHEGRSAALEAMTEAGITADNITTWSGVTARARPFFKKLRGAGKTEYTTIELPTARDEAGKRVGKIEVDRAEMIDFLGLWTRARTRAELLRDDMEGIVFRRSINQRPIKMRADDYRAWLAAIPQEVKDVVAGLKAHMSGPFGKELNDTWLAEHGVEIAREPDYWPSQRRKDALEREPVDAIRFWKNRQLDDQPFFKPLKGGRPAIVIGDGFATYTRYLQGAAAYIGKGAAVSDAERLLSSDAFKKAVREAHKYGELDLGEIGEHVAAYKGMDVPRVSPIMEWARRILQRGSEGVLKLKPHIPFYQRAQLILANTEIDAKYLSQGVRGTPHWNEIKAHSPVLAEREQGFRMGRMTSVEAPGSIKDFFFPERRFGLGRIHKGDMWTVRVASEGAYLEGADKGLSGEPLLEYAARRGEQITRDTNITSDVLSLPSLIRDSRQNPALLPLVIFRNQTSKQINMLRRAWYQYQDHPGPETRNKVIHVAAAIIANTIAVSTIAGLYGVGLVAAAGGDWRKKAKGVIWDMPSRLLQNFLVAGDVAAEVVRRVRKAASGEDAFRVDARDNLLGAAIESGYDSVSLIAQTIEQGITGEEYKAGPKKGEPKYKKSLERAIIQFSETLGYAGLPTMAIAQAVKPFLNKQAAARAAKQRSGAKRL